MSRYLRGHLKFKRLTAIPGGQITGTGYPPPEGQDYYVESNAGNNANNGESWDQAFLTLAKAITASNANIAASSKGWASRNRIFYKGDNNTEVLTTFPTKCDVIGCGSTDLLPYPTLVGNHVPTSGWTGTRFINMGFNDADGVIVTIPTGASGIAFINCFFKAGAATTTAILATASTDLLVKDCAFLGSWNNNFSTAAISLAAGNANRTIIRDSWFEETAGKPAILVNGDRTGEGSLIANNQIKSAGVGIDDDSDTFVVIGNRVISTATAAAAFDFNAALAADNWITGSDKTVIRPVISA